MNAGLFRDPSRYDHQHLIETAMQRLRREQFRWRRGETVDADADGDDEQQQQAKAPGVQDLLPSLLPHFPSSDLTVIIPLILDYATGVFTNEEVASYSKPAPDLERSLSPSWNKTQIRQ